MKYYLITSMLLFLIACQNNSHTDPNEHISSDQPIQRYNGELLRVSDITYACDHLTEDNIKKWYGLEKIVWLSKPSNQGLENSCSAAFYAGTTDTDVGIQVYDYPSLEKLNTDLEVLQEMQMERVQGLGYPAFWYGGNVYQKSLTLFYKGLKIVVTQPARDFYDEATHKKRSIQIAREYLATFN
ncbi:hypothetical protein [Nonlabens sp. YIK11]|uniref:hypothetical protein n=1 Tax=Nonlabens sp. YIK11 TaxID=1453349 RepID=UPI000AE893DA|nr:hypothetical protein [Nonlabens sp. YIK11]